MMNTFKRMMSLFLTLVIVFSMLPPQALATEPQSKPTVDTGDITLEGTNGFGKLLSEELETSQAESEEELASYESGYGIVDLIIEGDQATVEYFSQEDAVLMVAIYDENGLQMLASGKAEVSSEEELAYISIEGDMPEYFMAEAYLLDTFDLSPLCPMYDTPLYTQDMQELLNSTVDDYDEELVLNLDDNEDTNFAVYAETTKVIDEVAGFNTVVTADEDALLYVIENPDEQITSLVAGDVFCYPYGEDGLLIVKVASITIDGSTATITGTEDLELEDVFQLAKIESAEEHPEFEVDTSTADEGITYLGDGVAPQVEGGGSTTARLARFAVKIKDESGTGTTAITGSVSLGVNIDVSYLITRKQQYVEIKLEPALEFTLSVKKSIEATKTLVSLSTVVAGCVQIGFEPTLVLKFEGEIEFSHKFSAIIGWKVDKKGVHNISRGSRSDTEIKVEGSIFIGLDLNPFVAIVNKRIAKAALSAPIGMEWTMKQWGADHVTYHEGEEEYHSCKECISIQQNFVISLEGEFNIGRKKWEITFAKHTEPMGECYYSIDNREFGKGSCPYFVYRTAITVKRDDGIVYGGRLIVDGEDEYKLNDWGKTVIYLNKGKHSITAIYSTMERTKRVRIKEAGKVTINLSEEEESALNGSYDAGDYSGGIAAGPCGNNAFWVLYEGGHLTINGSGSMYDYNSSSSVPWSSYRNEIKKVTIAKGITTIGSYAFYGYSHLTTIPIPRNVWKIGSYAFYDCGLTSLSLPADLYSIGSYAFAYCTGLSTVSLPAELEEIPNGCFRGCTGLTALSVPQTVAEIGSYAFADCTGLTKLVIPDSMFEIGDYAFQNCTGLKQVQLPVEFAVGDIFNGCTGVESIHYTPGDTGVIPDRTSDSRYSDYYGRTMEYQSRNTLKKITLGSGITRIGNYAFYDLPVLESAAIPDSVVSIGPYAFYNCTALSGLALSDNITSIGSYAFYNNTKMSGSLSLTKLSSLGSYAFYNCSGLSGITLSKTLTSIPERTFYGCIGLTKLVIPDATTDLGNAAFGNCTGLTSVTLPVDYDPNYYRSDFSSRPSAFTGCFNVEYIRYTYGQTGIMPHRSTDVKYDYSRQGMLEGISSGNLKEVVFDDGITQIGAYAFYDCPVLSSVTIPDSVTTIGAYTFYNNTVLTGVDLPPQLKTLGSYAFYNCVGLAEITIPETLTAIPDYAFNGCTGFTELVIPDTVTDLGNAAFGNCTGLTSVTLPVDYDNEYYKGTFSSRPAAFVGCYNVEYIRYTVGQTGVMPHRSSSDTSEYYYACTLEGYSREKLKTVVFDDGITQIGARAFYNCPVLSSVTIPDSVTTIGAYTFYNNTVLTGVDLPPQLITLGSYAFNNCVGLTEITIPETLTAISDYAFNGCTGFTELVIPDTVTDLGYAAFGNCTGLTSVTLPVDYPTSYYKSSSTTYPSAFAGCCNVEYIRYTVGQTGVMPHRSSGDTSEYYYECTLEGYSREKLKTVVFDDGITQIGARAFYNCPVLSSVTIPDSVTTIGAYTFYNNTVLTDVDLPPQLITLGSYAFYNCVGLTEITIPETLTAISDYAFNGCTGFTELVIPDTVTELGRAAFGGCTGLTSVTLPVDYPTSYYKSSSTTYPSAFAGCCNVEYIRYTVGQTGVMPHRSSGDTSEYYYECTLEGYSREKLKEVVFDDGITQIGIRAFYNCAVLEDVTFCGNAPAFGSNSFYGVTANAYYPEGNDTWTEEVRQNYGGTLTWIPKAEAEPESLRGFHSSRTLETRMAKASPRHLAKPQAPDVQIEAVYPGEYETEITDAYTLKIASFSGLVPGEQYVMLALVDIDAADPLAADNLLSIAQAAAAEDGTLMFQYVQRMPSDISFVVACGASSQNLRDAVITFPEMVADGELQVVEPVVVYNGETLVEGTDYTVVGTVSFTEAGTYTCWVRGVRNYAGMVECTYTVTGVVDEIATGWSGATQWTLTSDGVLTVYGEGNMKNYGYAGGQPWLNKGVDIVSVVIEEGVASVGSGAFMNLTTLESVTFPETSLTKMGEAAFYGSGLKSVEIPASLWTIQPYTFKNCANLTEVVFPEGNLQKISDGAFYGTGLTELVLPDCLDILDVYAFKGCADLTSITIGTGLTELREAVFYGTAIPEITIPEGITKIGPYAFKNCVALETVDMPSTLTSVGEAAFYADTALKSVELPDAVTTIGNYAFRKCAAIETLTFGSELTTIGECAFYGCTSLTELVIPDKVTTIKPYAFKTCTGLTSVTLGSSVATIGEGAFNTCTGLKTIGFPASVEAIGDYCFSGSYNLWQLTFEGNAPAIGTGAFKGLNATAYYPGDNATWNSSNMLNYGGKLTWKAQ